jgi:hypothetical protein
MTSNKKESIRTAEDVAKEYGERLITLLTTSRTAEEEGELRRWAAERHAKAEKYIRELHQKAKAKSSKQDK